MPAGLRTPEPRIRILVADDHPAITCGLKALFDDQHDMRVVGIAGIDPGHRAAVRLLAEGRPAATVADQLGLGDEQLLATRQAAVQRLSPAATRANVPLGPRRGPPREPVAG